jgi:16S rRNA (adenine1518-N6/adenine1519-N6)-dimethyltransferase
MQNRQTYSYLAVQFARAGLKPLTRFGQNFLIDLNLVELIANSADITSQDIVLEVGTGTGSLTSLVAQKAGWVVTVEVDEGLYKLAGKELKDRGNVTQLLQDALKNKNRLAPAVLEAIEAARAKVPGGRLKLVANLPYNVATPIISNLLLLPEPPVMIVATIQKELADRIAASHDNRDYSALTIWIQSQCHVEIVRTLPPTVFWPQPKVTSAVIRLTRDPALGERITDLKFFHETVRALFFHRRKYLRSVVISAMQDKLDKAQVDRVLECNQFVATDRAEQLPVARIIDLVEALRREIGKSG